MNKVNLVVFIIFLNSIDYLLTTPVNSFANRKDSKFKSNTILPIFDTYSGKTSSDLNQYSVNPKTFHLFDINSWIVGKIMGALQIMLGKTIIPDSKINLLQAIVNPFRAEIYFDNFDQQSRNNAKITDHDTNNDKKSDYELNTILEVLKPKVIDGLSELIDSGILKKLYPIVNLTIQTINVEEEESAENHLNIHSIYHSKYLNDSLVYDLIDFKEFKRKSNHSGFKAQKSNSNIVENITQVNLMQEFKNLTNHSDKVTTNSSLINNQLQERMLSNDEDEFQKSNNTDHLQTNSDTQSKESIKDVAALSKMNVTSNNLSNNDFEKFNIQSSNDNIANETTDFSLINDQIIEEGDNKEILNKAEYILNEDYDKDKSIVSMISCEDNKCKEQSLHNNKTSSGNEILPKPNGSLEDDLKDLLKILKNGLIVKPIKYIKGRFIRLGEVLKRDFRMIFKMVRAMFGLTSSKCRYKFLCLFSSFFSFYTPDYIKKNMPTKVENYYIKIMEAANRHEFLNAIVTGYIGFDCNDFYADSKCPE